MKRKSIGHRDGPLQELAALFAEPLQQALQAAVSREVSAGAARKDGSRVRRLIVALEREDLLASDAAFRAFVRSAVQVQEVVAKTASALAETVARCWVETVHEQALEKFGAEERYVSQELFNDQMLPCSVDDFWQSVAEEFTFTGADAEMPVTKAELVQAFYDVKRKLHDMQYIPNAAADALRSRGLPVAHVRTPAAPTASAYA